MKLLLNRTQQTRMAAKSQEIKGPLIQKHSTGNRSYKTTLVGFERQDN